MRERVIARDKYGNKILIIKNVDFNGSGYDLMTDGRVCLSPALARKLAAALIEFADKAERKS